MHYMLVFRETQQDLERRKDPQAGPGHYGAWMAYIGAIHGAGKFVSGNGLEPPESATTLRIRGGKREVQDGPFADTREHLGGYCIVDVASVDEALEWAARAPCASTGSVEVRPCMPPPPGR